MRRGGGVGQVLRQELRCSAGDAVPRPLLLARNAVRLHSLKRGNSASWWISGGRRLLGQPSVLGVLVLLREIPKSRPSLEMLFLSTFPQFTCLPPVTWYPLLLDFSSTTKAKFFESRVPL